MKKQRIAYTVSRKNPLLWLAVLLAVLAAAGFFLRLGDQLSKSLWEKLARSILPGLGALYFAYQLAVNGKERLYRLSLPFWLLTAELLFWIWTNFLWYLALPLSLVAVFLAWLAHRALKGTSSHWLLALPVGAFLLVAILFHGLPSLHQTLAEIVRYSAEPLLLLAYLPLLLAIRKVEDGKYHPTWGDRFDGRRLRSLSPISVVETYTMPERNQANVFFPDKLEITELEKYIRAKRAEGFDQFGMTEALLAAFVRTASNYPERNNIHT